MAPRDTSRLEAGTDGPGESAAAREAQALAERAVAALWAGERAPQALGIRMVEIAPGRARLQMRVRADMLNGHGVCHGGVIFTLADSAFAFACNSYGEAAVAAGAAIEFLASAREGDELAAEAVEQWRSRRTGLYDATVTNQHGERIALFRGRAHGLGRRIQED